MRMTTSDSGNRKGAAQSGLSLNDAIEVKSRAVTTLPAAVPGAIGRRQSRFVCVSLAVVSFLAVPSAVFGVSSQTEGTAVSETGILSPDEDLPDERNVAFRATSGGVGRYVPGRWGVVKGLITNLNSQPTSSLIVVTPSGSQGVQFARRLRVPAKVTFESLWPVHISRTSAQGSADFEYLHFPGGEDDGVIRHSNNSREVPSFHGVAQRDPGGVTGYLMSPRSSPAMDLASQRLVQAMRYATSGSASVVTVLSSELTAHPECLDGVDQLAIADPDLPSMPMACDAIRMWIQRGGRAIIFVERTGPEVVRSLLGDSLPISSAGETTANEITLDLNPDYPSPQYSVRSVTRTFDEPVRYVRVFADAGETVWSIDGWPAAIRRDVGSGGVLVTMVASDVFIEPAAYHENAATHQLIPSSKRFLDAVFGGRTPPLISKDVAASSAAGRVGYELPSRPTAFLFLAVFPVSLAVAGLLLLRRSRAERLIIVIPCLSLLAAIPPGLAAIRARTVAPAMLIENLLVFGSPGHTEIPVDGFASAFVPSETDLNVSSASGARLGLADDAANADYRRLIWDGLESAGWQHLSQPAGLRTYTLQSRIQTKTPVRAHATFDENGLSGRILSDGQLRISDAMLAGVNHENISIRMSPSGDFTGTGSDRLSRGQYFRSTLLTDEQSRRAEILRSLFAVQLTAEGESFPSEPTLMFWDESPGDALQIPDSFRRLRSVLYLQPLELIPPTSGRTFTIPPQLLSYRSVPTAEGGMSSAFRNSSLEWSQQESAAKTRLELRLPKVCLPFTLESVDAELHIRAGARTVTVLAGEPQALETIAELQSPLGISSVQIPVKLIENTCRTGRLFIGIDVSELSAQMQADDLSGEQDDSWKVDRLLITLRGKREE